MTRTRVLLWSGLTVGAAIAAAMWWWTSAPAVQTAAPTRGPAVQAVYATGNVEAVHWAKMAAQVTARILEHCACEGDEVAKGHVLARLDNQEARANLAEAVAREDFLAKEVERYLSLTGQRVVSEQAYQRVASNYAQARAATAAAKERLGRYVLTAPMEGLVLRRDGEVGELVTAGEVMFWVGQPKPLRIVAEVDEEDIPLVRTGQRALIKSDAFPDRVLRGTVDHITPMGDPVTKSYRVWVTLPGDTPLLIGMTTEINVVVREVDDALLVPVEAVAGDTVWVVTDGRARRRLVKTGIIGDERAQITDGIGMADRVIVVPPDGLEDGDRVREEDSG